MKRFERFLYSLLIVLVRFGMCFWHPVFRVSGRERVPEGPCVLCGNHAGMADPIWTILAFRRPFYFRIMAKESVMRLPLLRHLLRWIGLIGVRRGENDVAAVKTALKTLKDGGKLLIYPEGTRVPTGRREAKTGAVLLALWAGCPVLPVYIQRRRRPFSALRLVVGEPYTLPASGPRPPADELRGLTDDLMERIYALGADVG